MWAFRGVGFGFKVRRLKYGISRKSLEVLNLKFMAYGFQAGMVA